MVVIAVVILIIALAIIGVSLSKGGSGETQWPPIVGACPDYWLDLQGNGSACLNTHSLGTCNLVNPERLYTEEANTNSADNTMADYTGISETECKGLCTSNKQCYGAAYRSSSRQCYLKSEEVINAAKQPDPDYTLLIKNVEGIKENTMDFTTPAFSGSNGQCAKYTWANNCGVVWDGITSGENPCMSSS